MKLFSSEFSWYNEVWKSNSFLRLALISLLFLILETLIFYPVFSTGFLSDDYCFLSLMKQKGWAVFLRPEDQLFMPVMLFVMNILFRTFGMNALPFHIFQALLHVANAVLIVAVAEKIMRDFHSSTRYRYFISVFSGLFFLLNPYQTEAVSWISAIGYPLSLIFSLVSLLLFLDWLKRNKNWSLIGVLVFFFLACFSKECALVLPGILVLIFFLKVNGYTGEEWKKSLVRLLKISTLMGLMMVIYFFIRFFAIHQFIGQYGADTHLNVNLSLLFSGFLAYHAKFFLFYRLLPKEVTMFLHYPVHHPWFALLIVAGITALLYMFREKIRKILDEKLLRLALLFYTCFLVGLIPFLNLETSFLGEIQSDRYGYYATGFFSLMVGIGAFALVNLRKPAVIFLLILFVGMGIQTYRLNTLWLESSRLTKKIVEAIGHEKVNGVKVFLIGVPDTYKGVYAFRSGFHQQLFLAGVLNDIDVQVLSYSALNNATDEINIQRCDSTITLTQQGTAKFVASKSQILNDCFTYLNISSSKQKIILHHVQTKDFSIYIIQGDGRLENL